MIIVRNNSGIGNKIKNVVSAMRRAYIQRDSISIDFAHQHLYSVPLDWGGLSGNVDLSNTWRLEIHDSISTVPCVQKNEILPIVHDSDTIYLLSDGIDCAYENINHFYRYEFLKFFLLFKFTPDILKAVHFHWDKVKNYNPVGVHIRSWVDEPGRKSKLFDLDMYTDEMMRYESSKLFYVASDDEEVISRLELKFPRRILSQPIPKGIRHTSFAQNDSFDRAALVDMLVLSKCSRLIGSYQSSFSECSWWFSKCQQSVVIPRTEFIRKLYAEVN